jgi:hypothetical protein
MDTARDLSAMVGELAVLKADATHWLTEPQYAALTHHLEAVHAAAKAALVEARMRVRLDGGTRALSILLLCPACHGGCSY